MQGAHTAASGIAQQDGSEDRGLRGGRGGGAVWIGPVRSCRHMVRGRRTGPAAARLLPRRPLRTGPSGGCDTLVEVGRRARGGPPSFPGEKPARRLPVGFASATGRLLNAPCQRRPQRSRGLGLLPRPLRPAARLRGRLRPLPPRRRAASLPARGSRPSGTEKSRPSGAEKLREKSDRRQGRQVGRRVRTASSGRFSGWHERLRIRSTMRGRCRSPSLRSSACRALQSRPPSALRSVLQLTKPAGTRRSRARRGQVQRLRRCD